MNRTRIGMLTPSSNTMLEPVLARMQLCMPHVSCHFSRFRVTQIALSEAGLEQFAFKPMVDGAALLADAGVDAIAWNGTSGAWLGFDRDEELCRRIASETSVPATTSALAFRDAFRLLGLTRIGLVTPYTDDVQRAIQQNWESAGVSCAAERHLGLSHNAAFAAVETERVAQMAREVAAEGCDAVAIVCTNMGGADIAAALEHELGRPVLDSVAVTLWATLGLLSIDTASLAAWGRIFSYSPMQASR